MKVKKGLFTELEKYNIILETKFLIIITELLITSIEILF